MEKDTLLKLSGDCGIETLANCSLPELIVLAIVLIMFFKIQRKSKLKPSQINISCLKSFLTARFLI